MCMNLTCTCTTIDNKSFAHVILFLLFSSHSRCGWVFLNSLKKTGFEVSETCYEGHGV